MQRKKERPSNDELIEAVIRACADVNRHTARVIRLLIEIEKYDVHLEEGFPSLFVFCVKRLGMSEGAAFLRTTAATLVKRFPMLGDRLERGELHMSTLAQLRHYLTPENVEEWANAARGKSKMEVKEMLAAKAPGPVKPSTLRKLPTIRTANDVTPVVERDIEPVTESRYRLALTITRQRRDELLYVRDLMMHRNPSGDLSAVVFGALPYLRRELEREVFGRTKRAPRDRAVPGVRARPLQKTSGKVPRPVRREVMERDGHRCTYQGPKGKRCSATSFLELDHIVPLKLGGTNEPSNLRVRCVGHNKLWAKAVYGADHVSRKIHLSQLKSAQRKAATAAALLDDAQPAPT